LKSDYIENYDEICIYRFISNGRNNNAALFRLKKILTLVRFQKPDICHIHTTSLFSFCLYLGLKFFRISTMVTVHGLAHIEKQNVWCKHRNPKDLIKYVTQSLTEFIFLSICPLFIVDTKYVADAIQKYKKQNKIFRMPVCKVIPQGVNEVFFSLENAPQKLNLLAVGSINKRKGHLMLIDAMQHIKLKFPSFSLSIVGALSDKRYFALMQARIIEKGLENNIRIYPNASFETVLKLYTQAEVFVLNTEEESQGIVFCEAMACGKPIVSSNVGGVPWVVDDNVNGFLSDFNDIDIFANNVIKLLENDVLRRKMEAANKIQSMKYNWRYIANEAHDLYQTII
jgi:glycosyltransferase involved in cell wall biosynthesis